MEKIKHLKMTNSLAFHPGAFSNFKPHFWSRMFWDGVRMCPVVRPIVYPESDVFLANNQFSRFLLRARFWGPGPRPFVRIRQFLRVICTPRARGRGLISRNWDGGKINRVVNELTAQNIFPGIVSKCLWCRLGADELPRGGSVIDNLIAW